MGNRPSRTLSNPKGPGIGDLIFVWDWNYDEWIPGMVLHHSGSDAFIARMMRLETRGGDREVTCYVEGEGSNYGRGGWMRRP